MVPDDEFPRGQSHQLCACVEMEHGKINGLGENGVAEWRLKIQ